jgi:hypothetical protein
MIRQSAICIFLAFVLAILSPGYLWSDDGKRPQVGKCELPNRVPSLVVETPSTLPDTTSPQLMILPGTVRPVGDFRDIVLAFIQSAPAKPIVLYVHGRGDEPSKSLKDGILQSVADEYKANQILFTWASSKGAFPESEARDAGPSLGNVFNQLKDIRSSEKSKGLKVTLLTHSMGSIVLEGFLKDYTGDLPAGLFDSVVISSSASTVDNHAAWVEKINFSPNVLITYGHEDPLLTGAGIGIGTARLGKHGTRQHGDKERVAVNAVYADFSQAVGSDHRYFVSNGGQACVYYFFNESLNGRRPDFSNQKFATEVTPKKDYLINK